METGSPYFIGKSAGNYYSDEYSCTEIWNEELKLVGVDFNHKEKITIPKEMFVGKTGVIWFYYEVLHYYGEEGGYGEIGMNYEVKENKVILSIKRIDR